MGSFRCRCGSIWEMLEHEVIEQPEGVLIHGVKVDLYGPILRLSLGTVGQHFCQLCGCQMKSVLCEIQNPLSLCSFILVQHSWVRDMRLGTQQARMVQGEKLGSPSMAAALDSEMI